MFRHGSPPPHLACSQMLCGATLEPLGATQLFLFEVRLPPTRENHKIRTPSVSEDAGRAGRVKNAETKQNISNKPESHFAVEIWSATKYRKLSLNRDKWTERNWNCLSQWRLRDLQGSGPLPSLSRLSRSEAEGWDRLRGSRAGLQSVGQLRCLRCHHNPPPQSQTGFGGNLFSKLSRRRWWRAGRGENSIWFSI